MEDELIVDLYWNRDEDAIGKTQEKYDRYLTKIAYNILANVEDSRESVNDTYLAAWDSMPPHRPAVLSTYLGKLTRRISIDCFRGRTRAKRAPSQYAMSLEELTVQETPGEEWIEDGIRYIASEAYGLEKGTDFLLYSPETPTEGLDEEFLTWWPRWNVEDTGTLNCWGLWNQEMGYGFFTY